MIFFFFNLLKKYSANKLHFSILLDKMACTELHLHGA